MTLRGDGAGEVYDNTPPPGEGHENVDMAVFMRIQNVNNELASGYNM